MKSGNSITLRNLHLQNSILYVILYVAVSVVLGLAFSDFYTKGEPREALVAQQMIVTGNYILPTTYGSEIAFKPPMYHWISAILSLPSGEVTELTARLPSAISLLVISVVFFVFSANRLPYRQSYVSILIFITAFEVHRAAITARVDMMLCCFIVLTLLSMYKWEDEDHLSGLPWVIPLLISGGILTKGPVALLLPLLIFFIYLLILRKYSYRRVLSALFYVAISSLLIPSLWYIAAYNIGGESFKEMVMAENFSRFLHVEGDLLPYKLGHEKPFYYPLLYVLYGFLPWILLLPFVPKYKKLHRKGSNGVDRVRGSLLKRLDGMPKLLCFSLVVITVTILFYMIPSSKRSVYLLPIYPFLSLFIASYLLRMQRRGRTALRVFSLCMGIIVLVLIALVSILTFTPTDSLLQTFPILSHESLTLRLVQEGCLAYFPLTVLLLIFLTVAVITLLYHAVRSHYTKLVVSNIIIIVIVHLLIDGPVLLSFKEYHSAQPFAEVVSARLNTKPGQPLYVINNLKAGFRNLYGLAFYLNKETFDFDAIKPTRGVMLLWEGDLPKLEELYGDTYHFEILERDRHVIKEGGSKQLLLGFSRL